MYQFSQSWIIKHIWFSNTCQKLKGQPTCLNWWHAVSCRNGSSGLLEVRCYSLWSLSRPEEVTELEYIITVSYDASVYGLATLSVCGLEKYVKFEFKTLNIFFVYTYFPKTSSYLITVLGSRILHILEFQATFNC